MTIRMRALYAALALAGVHQAGTAATHNSVTVPYRAWDGRDDSVHYSTPNVSAPLRQYTQSTTLPVRAGGAQQISYAETAGLPTVRTGSLAFDALFALAGKEMRDNAVEAIRDNSYDGGQPIACACFETGELWHYVWTRDLSYAAALGLGMLDPERVRNSLLFKLSGYRAGVKPGTAAAGTADGLQIIQDTGSGGSWPVSTDRVSWAFGADEALKALPPEQRQAFAATALAALRNTLENDRIAVYDSADGLYNGEQSFLDWREQSYASWIAGDLASMATSKALSTNVAHYKALTLAAQLAREQGERQLAQRYGGWAAALKQAINTRFWQADTGLYSSLTAGHFDGAALYKYDWLGQALAIIHGVADAQQAQSILAHYPHGPLGAPVIFPQQQATPVYHNRAIWPFVTGHGLRAATLHANVAVADAAYDTLMRSAAQNLSNMENLEWLSGQAMLDDRRGTADLSGPVVNSRRQLWSVGAYLGMVVGDIFGVRTTGTGIALQPFVTAKLRRSFGNAEQATLRDVRLRGKQLQVRLLLPPAAPGKTDGYYAVEQITLNGQPTAATLDWSALADVNTIEIRLGALLPGQQAIRRLTGKPYDTDPALYGPPEPRIASVKRDAGGIPTVQIAALQGSEGADGSRATAYNIYRNGVLVAPGVTTLSWRDPSAAAWPKNSATAANAAAQACYAVEAVYTATGNRSHHSVPACLLPGEDIAVDDVRVRSNQAVKPAIGAKAGSARGYLGGWGAPADTFNVRDVRITHAGNYALQLRYRNTAHQVNLGISGGVKWLEVRDASGKRVAAGVVQLPHSPGEAGPSYSTPLRTQLKPGSYRLSLHDFYNMSYLQSNTGYGDAGGVAGPSNRFDLYGVRIMPLSAPAVPRSAHAH